jgi:hypothetical protein
MKKSEADSLDALAEAAGMNRSQFMIAVSLEYGHRMKKRPEKVVVSTGPGTITITDYTALWSAIWRAVGYAMSFNGTCSCGCAIACCDYCMWECR